MLVSRMFLPTQREVPSEAEIASHQLMLRAGLMRKVASGIYAFLPLGYRAFRKVESIVREEMDRAGAQELIMPAVLPAETYMESGRWSVFGPEMFRLKDRGGREFCLGPTHEEPFTETVRNEIRSYRGLPLTLYQIQHKYRDEKRPRFGVMRSREFVMKDAYSFDRDETGLDVSYQAMYRAYRRVFDRCSLDYIVVDADSGAMGGSGSQEFMVRSDVGEAMLAFCDACGYAANDEKAEAVPAPEAKTGTRLPVERVATPNVKTIEELMKFFGTSPKKFAKTLLYRTDDGRIVAAMVRGDRELNETKLHNLVGAAEIEMAAPEDVVRVTGAAVGFAGPVGLKVGVDLYVDREVAAMENFIVGANATDLHLKNVNLDRDFTATLVADLRNVEAGDACPTCGKPLGQCRGIEVGHIFKLGTKYSKALHCNFLDEEGRDNAMVMGCYGIGVNRTLAAVIEQHHDGNGIVWPIAVAPYHVMVVPVMISDANQMAMATDLHDRLTEAGIDVLMDDRDERPGVKFKDADLIGIPLRITIGRKSAEGIVEFKERAAEKPTEMTLDEAFAKAVADVRAALRA